MDDIDKLIELHEELLEKAYKEGNHAKVLIEEDNIELLEHLKTIDKNTKRHVEGDEQIARRPDVANLARRKTKRRWFKDWAYRRL